MKGIIYVQDLKQSRINVGVQLSSAKLYDLLFLSS